MGKYDWFVLLVVIAALFMYFGAAEAQVQPCIWPKC